MHGRSLLKLGARALVACALLGLVVWLAQPAQLARSLSQASLPLFTAALAVSILSNVASAIRWAYIARVLGLVAAIPRLIAAYARGMTLNAVLPGATLSGDALRTYELHRTGNPLGLSALSVVLDRASGLWVLCLVSGGFALAAATRHGLDAYPVAITYAPAFTAALAVAAIAPLALFLPLPTRLGRLMADGARFVVTVLRSRAELARQLFWSAAVQLLSITALWVCAQAVGLVMPFWVIAVSAAPIFIMAAIPLGFAGWGTRELAAIAVLAAFGVPPGQAAATAILYGLCALAQAVLAIPLLLRRRPPATEDAPR